MYFASFYARGEKCILVNLLISRILEEVNVDETCVVLLYRKTVIWVESSVGVDNSSSRALFTTLRYISQRDITILLYWRRVG